MATINHQRWWCGGESAAAGEVVPLQVCLSEGGAHRKNHKILVIFDSSRLGGGLQSQKVAEAESQY